MNSYAFQSIDLTKGVFAIAMFAERWYTTQHQHDASESIVNNYYHSVCALR